MPLLPYPANAAMPPGRRRYGVAQAPAVFVCNSSDGKQAACRASLATSPPIISNVSLSLQTILCCLAVKRRNNGEDGIGWRIRVTACAYRQHNDGGGGENTMTIQSSMHRRTINGGGTGCIRQFVTMWPGINGGNNSCMCMTLFCCLVAVK